MNSARFPQLLTLARIESEPWKNGAGTTRVIAAGTGWRISLASVSSSSEFSIFEATWRHSMFLDGGSIELRSGQEMVTLVPHTQAHYRGDLRWKCELRGKAATVLNVMCRDGLATAAIRQAESFKLPATRGPLVVMPIGCSALCSSDDSASPILVGPGQVVVLEEQGAEWVCRMTDPQPSTGSGYVLGIQIRSIVEGDAEVNEDR